MKATVYYSQLDSKLEVGKGALVWPINHSSPFVSNTKQAVTSPVIAIGKFGAFETQNTKYLPEVRMPKTLRKEGNVNA